ncbi:hypothetical protein [Bradyrhizobium sp.]
MPCSCARIFHPIATLLDVVTFYNNRFNVGLTDQNIADLVAFLRSP